MQYEWSSQWFCNNMSMLPTGCETDFLCWFYGETQCSETQPWSVQLGNQGRVLSGKHLASRRLLSIIILLGPCEMSINNSAQHTRSKKLSYIIQKAGILKRLVSFLLYCVNDKGKYHLKVWVHSFMTYLMMLSVVQNRWSQRISA